MVERRSTRHRTALVISMAASLAALAGCSSGSGSRTGAASCAAPSPAPPAESALMPAGLSFDRVGTVTEVRDADGHLTVEAVSTKPLDELTVLIQDAVTAAGYRPAGMDNEGDEAEVFFSAGSYAAGQAEVRRAACEGQWKVELSLVHLDAVPTSSAPTSS